MIKLLRPTHQEASKRKVPFFLLISIVTILLFTDQICKAQVVNFERDKDDSPSYAKFTGISASFDLGDQGFILAIGSGINNAPYQIYHFDAEGKLIWKKVTKTEYANSGKDVFLCTPDNIFYYIQAKPDRINDKKTYVHQISVDGAENKFEVEGKEEFGKKLQTIVCDKNYLYFVTTENGDESHNKKKVDEKLILTRFDHKTMVSKTFPVITPAITAGDETSFWSYLGAKDDIKYFTSKHADTDLNKNDFTVIGVDASGEVKSNIKISQTLEEGKFIRPCYAVERKLSDAAEIVRLDYEEKMSASQTSFLADRPTSSGHIVYDRNTDSFLVYGLYGPKPFKRVGPVYQGSFIYKYDLTGKTIWKTEQPAGDKLMDVRAFRVDFLPTNKSIKIQTFPDKRIIATLGEIRGTKASYLFSAEGKFTNSDFMEIKDDLNYQSVKTMALTGDIKSINYIETILKDEKGSLSTILNSKGEVLIYYPSNGKPFKTIFFKK